LLLVALCFNALGATTLSVVSLSEALKNPQLKHDNDSAQDIDQARDRVLRHFINQPSEAEIESVHQRLDLIARHQDTRLGRLFFAALDSMPALEHLPEGATRAEIIVHWPLALGAEARVRVAWVLKEEEWLIEVLTLQLRGSAAAPVSAASPYFGDEPFNAALLDVEEIGYLLGRNPLTRNDPDAPPFDEAAALARVFARDDGAVESVWEKLSEEVTPRASTEARADALRPHLQTDAERDALDREKGDPEFWLRVMEQIAHGREAARPSSLPARTGARATWEVTVASGRELEVHRGEAVRLAGGYVAPKVIPASRTEKPID